MRWLKRFRVPLATTIVAGVIAWSLYAMLSPSPQDNATAPQGQVAAGPTRTIDAEAKPAAQRSGPRTVLLPIRWQAESNAHHGQQLATALAEALPVEQATWKNGSVILALAGPLNLSDLLKHLEPRQLALVEDQVPVRGEVRLHAAGMT